MPRYCAPSCSTITLYPVGPPYERRTNSQTKRLSMKTLENIYGAYKQGKFWVITAAISSASAILLPGAVYGITSSTTPGESFASALILAIAVIGLSLFPFAIWQHIARKRFFAWLDSQWANLETGATHPDGYTVTFDTPLVKYQGVFSAVLATVSFASRPYVLEHRSAGVAQASFTLFSAVFGWWFLGFDGAVETIKAIVGNVRSSQTFTLRQLLSQQDNT